ncbi:glycoside hydrolase family 99-like domain-containing protein [Amphritea pacifica]|uniref:Glycoside hydrolase family 99-like domain-containing protein n=1 Tax=Amphritea pacifica TaxID=2811233 RepID=A0ABS2W5Y7_9GAMM|nr:glycoside hydrolase family 99-like domain-containing protein [Amphritea pacifica]MBN0987015.1 glycoside hydrolase family 99-like domain-containing protein [Amphritea pacifica]
MRQEFEGDFHQIKSGDGKIINGIYESGLFDSNLYCQLYSDIKDDVALVHYYYNGWAEGRMPSYLFDTVWYLKQNADVAGAGLNPLVHYLFHGDSENRQPSPYFNKECFLQVIPGNYSKTSLSFFYENERNLSLSAHEYFDLSFYLDNNHDVRDSGVSPYYHFLYTGVYEGRNPREDISLAEYCQEYNVDKNKVNPFLHFITVSGEEYLKSRKEKKKALLLSGNDVQNFRLKGPCYEEPIFGDKEKIAPKVKALAYYLPQFHPFTENDGWWGQGFTEWSNVTRGLPRFNGHYQPHLPKHLGYYDLRVKETMLEQVKLAKGAGLYGFCFYHYWFNGKRLMEKPVNMFLDNKDIEMPFCIMWANENWTRTWDGFDKDILIKQDYFEDDDEPFIRDIGRHFSDERYIRIDGRPLFFIYRPGIIPNTKKTIKRWRELCSELLGEEPLFYMAQAFKDLNPYEFGMDGAIEFPPHKIGDGLDDVSRGKGLIDPDFTGHYPSYDALIESSLSETEHDFPLIRGATPTWDNEARKPSKGMGFVDSTPEKFEYWLKNLNKYALQNPISDNESFVVINAWNEWAEGAHLEPDVYWGASYLNATYRAMYSTSGFEDKVKLILVGHDAYKHGAQLLTLNIFKTLRECFGVDAICILRDGGPLVDDYKSLGPTYVADGSVDKFEEILNELNRKNEINYAICNSAVSGLCVGKLAKQGIKVISLIHELPTLINEYSLEEHVKVIAKNASKIVFAADFVKDSFESLVGNIGDKAVVKPQGIYQTLKKNVNARSLLRNKLNINNDAKVVINSGYADLRKGFDLFVQTVKECVKRDNNFHFVWLGNVETSLDNWILKDIKGTEFDKHLHLIPFTTEISLYLEGADVFAMTSREDPFPSVVLESLALGTPVVGFEGGGGFTDALEKAYFGELVPMANCVALADAIENQIVTDSEELQVERSIFASEKYDWNDYVFSLVEYLIPDLKRVSVAVPNYNYEQYIGDRLTSVFRQSYPIYELIVLDDKSSDNSVNVIEYVSSISKRSISLVVNEENSGSVFKQWDKSTRLAKGEYLWIAEADDLADPAFISTIMCGEKRFTFAYADSKQIDENDGPLADDYRYYYDAGMIEKLDNPGMYNGLTVIQDCLSIKNQFMNVSSVIFDRKALQLCFDRYMDGILGFKVAGDWFVYVQLLKEAEAKCKILGAPLNTHRRHTGSVTKRNFNVQLKEIIRLHSLCETVVVVDKEKQNRYLNEVQQVLGSQQ